MEDLPRYENVFHIYSSAKPQASTSEIRAPMRQQGHEVLSWIYGWQTVLDRHKNRKRLGQLA